MRSTIFPYPFHIFYSIYHPFTRRARAVCMFKNQYISTYTSILPPYLIFYFDASINYDLMTFKRAGNLKYSNMVGYILSTERIYGVRLCPLSFYSDTKFVQRYRLTKEVVRILIRRFSDTQGPQEPRGKHAISHKLKVCTFFFFTMSYHICFSLHKAVHTE